MRKIVAILILFSVVFINAQETKFKRIDSIVESKVKENDPGLAVGIIKDGKIIYKKYHGLANLQHQVKFSEKTRSNIASTAKQFTALMILDLSLKGKLSLEDDIRKYLPNLYKKVENNIKIRHLINHTSGIRDYVELFGLEGDVWWKRFGLDNGDILELLEKQEDLGFEPGSQYSYSNSNYNVLAKIIETISEKKFIDYSNQFFKQLGMNETSFVERYMGVIPNRANPYSDWGYGEWFDTPTVTKTSGEGFLFTTLKDQLIYEQAVQNASYNNNVLLIKSQQPIPNSEITTYGFGLELEDRLGRTAVHHSGGTYGFNSQMYRFPEEKLTVFIMSNNGNISSNLIAQEIATLLLPEIKKKDQYNNRFYENRNDTEQLQVIGQYYSPRGYLTRIVEEDGNIYFRQGKSLRIELISENKNSYHLPYDSKQKLVFYKNEMVLFQPSGDTSIFKRSTTLPASSSDIESLVGTYYNNELEISFDLKLIGENTLKFKFSNEEQRDDVEVFNREELLAGNNFDINVKRDAFDRVTDMLLSYDRAKNMRFQKKTYLKFQPKIQTKEGSIQVTTIGSKNGDTSDILLTKNDAKGNEVWFKRLGGNSYDKASSIIDTKDGYLIIGSTSSYGKGNYDIYVIKTDKKGKKLWQNTYGTFWNDYGYFAEKTTNGYLIKGTTQNCSSNTDINRTCTNNVWYVSTDDNGKELSNTILEEIK